MMITVLVNIKGGVSERVSSSWGEETSSVSFQGLEMKWRTQRRDVGLSFSSFCSPFSSVHLSTKYMCKCVFVYVSCQTPGVGPLVSDCQARIERSRLSACHTQAGHHNSAIRQSVDHSERCQSSSETWRSYVSPWCWATGACLETARQMWIHALLRKDKKDVMPFSEFLLPFTDTANDPDSSCDIRWWSDLPPRDTVEAYYTLSFPWVLESTTECTGRCPACHAHSAQLDIAVT